VEVKGQVVDGSNQKVTNYNGDLYVDVLDKAQRITTQNNHGDGNMTYTDRPNVLFSGKANVTAGDFSFTFMIPRT
jgi:hypothetical protein